MNNTQKHAIDLGNTLMGQLLNRVDAQAWQELQKLHDDTAMSVIKLQQAAKELYQTVSVFAHVPEMLTFYETQGNDTVQACTELEELFKSWTDRTGIVKDTELAEFNTIVDGYVLCGQRYQTCMQQTLLEMTSVARTVQDLIDVNPGDVNDAQWRQHIGQLLLTKLQDNAEAETPENETVAEQETELEGETE